MRILDARFSTVLFDAERGARVTGTVVRARFCDALISATEKAGGAACPLRQALLGAVRGIRAADIRILFCTTEGEENE